MGSWDVTGVLAETSESYDSSQPETAAAALVLIFRLLLRKLLPSSFLPYAMEDERVIDETRPLLADGEQARTKSPKKATPLPVVQIGKLVALLYVYGYWILSVRSTVIRSINRAHHLAKPPAVYQRSALAIFIHLGLVH